MDSRFLDVNRDGVLRIPGLLWVSLALLARYWVLLLAVAVSARRTGDTLLLLGQSVSLALLAMELPALVVAYAGANRTPKAGRALRLIWRYGRELIAAAIAANLIWTIALLAQSHYWKPWPQLFLASSSLLDLAVGVAVYTSPYYRQLFGEFPSRPVDEVTR